MPSPSKGPRLYPRKRKGRETVYVIRDGEKEVGTECGLEDRIGAEEALKNYIADKHSPDLSERDPARLLIADALNFYAGEKKGSKSAVTIGYHLPPLLNFWGQDQYSFVSSIRGASCRAYVEWRTSQNLARATKNPRKVTKGMARRELETLNSAVQLYHAENTLLAVPKVTKPKKAPARYPWLTRSQVAQMLWDLRKLGDQGRHMIRFIIIGIYTGSRHSTITGFRWVPSTSAGWFDVEAGLMYRRGTEEDETNKRRPAGRIPARLLAHLRRWHRMDMEVGVTFRRTVGDQRVKCRSIMTHVIHYGGKPVKKVRKAFERLCARIGLVDDETPHVLRHTCTTWAMQNRADPWELCGFLGMSLKMLLEVYGHHHPDYQGSVSDAMNGPRNKQAGAKLGPERKSMLKLERKTK